MSHALVVLFPSTAMHSKNYRENHSFNILNDLLNLFKVNNKDIRTVNYEHIHSLISSFEKTLAELSWKL